MQYLFQFIYSIRIFNHYTLVLCFNIIIWFLVGSTQVVAFFYCYKNKNKIMIVLLYLSKKIHNDCTLQPLPNQNQFFLKHFKLYKYLLIITGRYLYKYWLNSNLNDRHRHYNQHDL